MKKHSLMPNRTGFPFSRDEFSLPCKNSQCYLHSGSGYCSSPAAVEINAGGVCGTWLKYRDSDEFKNKGKNKSGG